MGGTFRLRMPREQYSMHIDTEVQALLDLVDTQMSGWDEGSDLSRFNQSEVGEWVSIPAEMTAVVALGLEASAETNGALNICMGHNSRVYGHGTYSAPIGGDVPKCYASGDSIEQDKKNGRVRKKQDIALDLNSIAKGYSVDLVGEYLQGIGVRDYMLEVAGDIYAYGVRPDKMPWTVALELPLPDKTVPLRFVPLSNCAIATSGNYRRFRKTADGFVGHLIDPETGKASSEIYCSVSVVAPSSARADGLATALFAMGPDAGFAFAAKNNLAAIFISRKWEGFEERGTDAMNKILGHVLG